MPRLMAYFYDRIMNKAEQACLQNWRRDLLQTVQGDVLEIGAGTGANLNFYPESVGGVILSEPDDAMRAQLKQKIAQFPQLNIELINDAAEVLSLADETVDVVVVALVCCSVQNPLQSLAEIYRVLKPGGKFIFLEHVAASEGSSRRKWQNFFNPLWKRIAGNCHLNRETEQAIKTAGFDITDIQRESIRKVMPLVRPSIRGVAMKPFHSRS